VSGGMVEGGIVWGGVEDSREGYEIYKEIYSNKLKTGY